MSWRLAGSLIVLRDEVNHRWPHRGKGADGTIGDARHQAEGSSSDHNPWVKDSSGVGVVRAFDITTDGTIDAQWLSEHLRSMGQHGDARLNGGGYVIYNRRIASSQAGWTWRPYTGSDPHTGHIHVSVSQVQNAYDSAGPWGLIDSTTEKVTPMYRPPLGPIAAVLRTKDDPVNGPIVAAASPDGAVFCWAIPYTGAMTEPELRGDFVGREVAQMFWADDGGYGLIDTADERYEPRIKRITG